MFNWLSDPNAWLGLATLVTLEIILGIDNIIFLSLVVAKLPKAQQPFARKLGLSCAMIMRILLLSSLNWITQMSHPLLYIYRYKITSMSPETLFETGQALPLILQISIKDMVLFFGGLFLIFKGIVEIKEQIEKPKHSRTSLRRVTLLKTILQIMILDVVFSLDSVITAIGLSNHLVIMIIAVILAIFIMIFQAKLISDLVETYPTMKMLALAALILVGAVLMIDSIHYEIPRGYIYFSLFFALAVEVLNLLRRKRRTTLE